MTAGEPAARAAFRESNEDLGIVVGESGCPEMQRRAFEELFKRLWRASVEWARSAGGDGSEAEDAANLAWASAWRYRHRFDPARGAYATWLRAIVRNETVDLLASESRHRHTRWSQDLGECPQEHWLQGDHTSGMGFVWEVFADLTATRPEFAEGLMLKASGFRDREIAQHLGVQKVGTVGSRLFRAKRFIADGLARRGVLFVPGDAGLGSVPGLVQLCRTGEGVFYGLAVGSDLELLPPGRRPQKASTLVLEAFFVSVWRAAGNQGRRELGEAG